MNRMYLSAPAPRGNVTTFIPSATPQLTPIVTAPKPEQTFFQKYKKPLLIGGAALLLFTGIVVIKPRRRTRRRR